MPLTVPTAPTPTRMAWHFTTGIAADCTALFARVHARRVRRSAKRNGTAQADLMVAWNPALGSECGGQLSHGGTSALG